MTETQNTEMVPNQQLSMPETHTFDHDLETGSTGAHSLEASTSMSSPETETLDIEHVPVQDDPRKWSPLRKVSFPT